MRRHQGSLVPGPRAGEDEVDHLILLALMTGIMAAVFLASYGESPRPWWAVGRRAAPSLAATFAPISRMGKLRLKEVRDFVHSQTTPNLQRRFSPLAYVYLTPPDPGLPLFHIPSRPPLHQCYPPPTFPYSMQDYYIHHSSLHSV